MMTQLGCKFERVVQGALNFVSGSSAPITPSFAYVPRTSDDDKYRKTERNKDMYCYTDEEVDEMLPRLKVVTVHKGDLILWLSSTPHCNVGATTVPDNVAGHELVRAVSFICWAPRVTQADGVGDAKARYAYEQGGSCNHVPNAFSKGGSGKHFSDRLALSLTYPGTRIATCRRRLMSLWGHRASATEKLVIVTTKAQIKDAQWNEERDDAR